MDITDWTSRSRHPSRDDIVERVIDAVGEEEAETIILFDGQEHAFLGIAERFEPILVERDGEVVSQGGQHQFFAVYSYEKMIEGHLSDGMSRVEAIEYLEYNTLDAYVGERTPAVLHDEGE